MKFLKRRREESRSATPENLYLLVGLGNPGREYKQNRHNIGFMAADEIAEHLGEKFTRVQSNALVAKGNHGGKRILLAKPQTFMNLSGQAVSVLQRFYKLPLSRLLIMYDDVDLPFETIRLKPSGGSAGQKGMRSIIERLGSQDFARMRLGIGRPAGRKSTPAHVLQDFSSEEIQNLPFVLDRAKKAALTFIDEGIEHAMNHFNQTPE